MCQNKEVYTWIVASIIQRLVAHYDSASASLADLRLFMLCVLGYEGLFRINELDE